jgi:hypothetical protein
MVLESAGYFPVGYSLMMACLN